MYRMKRRTLLIVLVVGALAAGGAAFTNSITGNGTTNNTAGYADISVQGASLTDAVYSFSADGSTVTGVNLTFSGDLSGDNVKALMGTTSTGTLAPCDATPVYSSPNSTVTCTFASAVPTGTATHLDVLVANN